MATAPLNGRHASAAAVAGVAAGGLALGVSELMAGTVRRTPSLVGAVGDLVIDWLPAPVVHFGIETFGTNDKAVLVGVILVLSGLAAAGLGRLGLAAFHRAAAGFAAFGVVGALAAPPGSSGGTGPGVRLDHTGGDRRHRRPATAAPPSSSESCGFGVAAPAIPPRGSRRRFTDGAARRRAGPAGVPRSRRHGGRSGNGVLRARSSSLPGPSSGLSRPLPASGAADPVAAPTAASVDVPGVSPVVVPSSRLPDRHSSAGPAGGGRRPLASPDRRPGGASYELDFSELLALPMVEEYVTLFCVSNEVGGERVGNAAWRGVRLADLLQRSGVLDAPAGLDRLTRSLSYTQ